MIPKPFLRRRQQNQIKAAEAANARALAAAMPGPREMTWGDLMEVSNLGYVDAKIAEAQRLAAGEFIGNAVCPKCGRQFTTRHVPHFHLRACKGVSDGGD